MKYPRAVANIALGLSAALAPGIAAAQPQPPEAPKPASEPARAVVWKNAGRGYLGVEVMGLTPELREHFGAPEDSGVLVSRVVEKGPAAAVGIQVGDVLTSIDGESLARPQSLSRAVRGKKGGETVVVELQRDRTPMSFTVSVSERDRAMIDLGDMYFSYELPELPEMPFPPGKGAFPPGTGAFIGGPGLRLDEEAIKALEESMRELEGKFDSDEWREKIKRIQEIDLSKVQERMKEVEERLKKLEKELQSESTKKKLEN